MSILHSEKNIQALRERLNGLSDPNERLEIGRRIREIEDAEIAVRREESLSRQVQGPSFLENLFSFEHYKKY